MATVFTTKGNMDEALLDKKEGVIDNDNEYTTWEEYSSSFCPRYFETNARICGCGSSNFLRKYHG